MRKKNPLLMTEEDRLSAIEELKRTKLKLLQQNRDYEDTHKIEFLKPLPHQQSFFDLVREGKKTAGLVGGNQIGKCLTFQSLIDTPNGKVSVGELFKKGEPFDVYAWDGEKKVIARASAPLKKPGIHQCYRIVMDDGQWVEAADYHRILTLSGAYKPVENLHDAFQASLWGRERFSWDGPVSCGFRQESQPPLVIGDNQIISYIPIGCNEVYDFEVEKYHNYVAADLVHHNTIACVNLAGAFSLGCTAPWDKLPMFPSEWARENNGKEVVGRILCKDWEKAAKTVIVPKLHEWLPAGTYETKKNNVGVESEWFFPKTKSSFTICTYNEDTKSHEGWTGDWAHADEPPPRDKYVANRRGLVARNGIFTMAMTSLDEPWILDEIVLKPDPSVGIIANIPITANTYLSEEAIRIYEKDLTEDEKTARIAGGWLQLTGRIWKAFNPQVHVIPAFQIPPDWPVEAQIDFHLTTPHAISFNACDPLQRYYICDEIWENCGSEEIADHIGRMKIKNAWRMKKAEIDALSKGDKSYVKNRFQAAEDSFTIIERKLRKYGVNLGVGSKDEKSYIKAVETRLKGTNGPNPTLYIFDTCKETIKQVSRWSYDDNGRPLDNGHFPECIGRFTQTGLKYTDPRQFNQPLNLSGCPI